MYSNTAPKNSRCLATNTSHNMPGVVTETYHSYQDSDKQLRVFQYPRNDISDHTNYYKHTAPRQQDNKRRMEQDDSLTNMEWLPDVSLPYMQQVKCKIVHDKTVPRKRNRTMGSKECGSGFRKPDYSYAMLIYKAINDTDQKRMQLFQIYEWIENHFLYYKHTPGTHWKSSIRHNLSLHKIFVKEAPPASLKSKGSFWALDRRLTEEDLLLSLQPKRPRLSRISNGESTCINRYAKGPTFYPALHHTPAHQQSVNPMRVAPVERIRGAVHPSVGLPVGGTQLHGGAPHFPPYLPTRQPGREPPHYHPGQAAKLRPNILSKVVRKDKTDPHAVTSSSPNNTSLMNLNQLFHTHDPQDSNISPTNSYESGYSSSSLSSQTSPKPKNFVCSTPIRQAPWSSPEFNLNLRNSPQLTYTAREPARGVMSPARMSPAGDVMSPLVGEELPNLAHYMGNMSSCSVKQERREAGVFWSPPRQHLKEEVKKEVSEESELSELLTAKQEELLTSRDSAPRDPTSPKHEDKVGDIAELISQFINEGEVCMLNGSLSTTPLRQYLTEEDQGALALDLDSPKRPAKKTSRRSLNIE